MTAAESVGQLTEPQRECLRLVLAHYSSKEIAQRLGVGPSAVDKRIERAVQLLGASSRFEAARRLAAYEGVAEPSASDRVPRPVTSDPLPSQPIDVAPEPEPGDEEAWPAALARFEPITPPTAQAVRVDWSRRRRAAAIVLLAFALAAAMLVLPGVVEVLVDVFARHPDLRNSLGP